MESAAQAKNIRISPQKVRLVVDQIKKMHPKDAIKILDFIPNKSATILKKVVISAMANAQNNFGLKEDFLNFKQIIVSKGPMSKRYRAIARGRVHPILKRTSHIKVVLESPDEEKKPAKVQAPINQIIKDSKVEKTAAAGRKKNGAKS